MERSVRVSIVGDSQPEENHRKFVSLSLTEVGDSRKLLRFHVRQVRAVSSAVRASGLHPEGRVFKSRTAHHLRTIPSGAVVQSVRTPACHAGGREFESRRPRHFHLIESVNERSVLSVTLLKFGTFGSIPSNDSLHHENLPPRSRGRCAFV